MHMAHKMTTDRNFLLTCLLSTIILINAHLNRHCGLSRVPVSCFYLHLVRVLVEFEVAGLGSRFCFTVMEGRK